MILFRGLGMSNIVFCLSSTVFTPMPVTVYNLFRDYYNLGRGGDLMVSALYLGVNSPGSSPGWGHCVVFLGKTLYSHGASLHPGV